jgi:hypothetical protein
MVVIAQYVFQDNFTEYGDLSQRANLLFKRRDYFTATIIS